MGVIRDLEALETSGLLWFINRVTLEPRGYRLCLVKEGDEVKGWTILRSDAKVDDALLAKAERLFEDLLART
jgi:hypothetical protein